VEASAAERDLLKQCVEACEAADFRAFESIIRADVSFRMPPQPDTAAGRDPLFALMIEGGFGSMPDTFPLFGLPISVDPAPDMNTCH
jgi:hypothetical protein